MDNIKEVVGYEWNGRFFATRIEAVEAQVEHKIKEHLLQPGVNEEFDFVASLTRLCPVLEEQTTQLCKARDIEPSADVDVDFESKFGNNEKIVHTGLCIMLATHFRECTDEVLLDTLDGRYRRSGFAAGAVLYTLAEPGLIYAMSKRINELTAKLRLEGELDG